MLSVHNQKIKMTGKVYGFKSACFDLPAGHTCPAANLCHSRVIIKDGKRVVEDMGGFRCYAVKAEVQYPLVYNHRRENYVRTLEKTFISDVIGEIKANKFTLVRIHSSGDFYNHSYFQKWIQIVKSLPDVLFFAYTKQATFVKHLLDNPIPNFRITYSMGGIHDKYAIKHKLPHCTVIIGDYNPENLPISCTDDNPVNDFEYIVRGESFGIRLH